MSELFIFNTLTGQKEKFVPIQEGKVGMYVCGPTLYSEQHIGNLRTFMSFDMIRRYLEYLGYKVKYVRNITDCGHIANSEGDAVDRIGAAAKSEQMESLEIVYKYNVSFQEALRQFNILPPNIEPTATAHIQEQIEIIEKIIANGYGYVSNGAVYFDIKKYTEKFPYGVISGRILDELLEETRELHGMEDRKSHADFALWKKALPEDMQIWRSPWGDGNPGWHIECTAMSTKYLGKEFDIHGGGMDLKFPHHENEVAQSCGAGMKNPARYWMHANMLNVNGKKMSKSMGTRFYPNEIVDGTTIFSKPYAAPVVRFFMMMGHYRSELDFTNDGLLAAEKGYQRLTEAFHKVSKLKTSNTSSISAKLETFSERSLAAMNDDFNTSKLIAEFFELATIINRIDSGEEVSTEQDIEKIRISITKLFEGVLGIDYAESSKSHSSGALNAIMDLIIDIRKDSRENKNWTTSDKIRDALQKAGIELMDGKDGTTWKI